MKRIEINPMTRLEGHGKISIFLNDEGNVDNAFFQTVELRGYERFLRGMPIEEVPRTVSTICGVCRGVHYTASVKAADAVYNVAPTPTARKIRELFLNAHYVEDHCAILYALGFPDFVVGPTASPAVRNLIGLIEIVGEQTGRAVLKKRRSAVRIMEILGGRPLHAVAAVPGGWSKRISEEERQEILELSRDLVELGQMTLQVFEDVVLKNKQFMELVLGDMYKVVCNYVGTVDEQDKLQYYDGIHKIVDPAGKEIGRFQGKEYLDYIAERVLPWSYQKMPYLKKAGWQDIADGDNTSLYCVGPLARYNIGSGFDTPLAQEAYEKMKETLPPGPVHNIMVYHWARAVELLNAAEKVRQLAEDESITAPDIRTPLGEAVGEGVGIIEAVRGLLIHHYKTDSRGIVEDCNLIVATTHNKGPINVAIRRAADHFIKDGKVDEGILNMVEMAYRPYDLCLACATHALPGRSPLQINIYDAQGKIYETMQNF
ncbi:Ni/Fe hydrogenase subunit alpha [Desulfoscipio sp. XC116]|uniref:Ni/Fe hydrogenase subunit alpha n=1 Tax=Desulfoscipio sp. XC116 TaxID=3144975 RepID=UPI00325C1646